ncbi:MAG: guanylate kinase [Steroidobacteraceae bacterium]
MPGRRGRLFVIAAPSGTGKTSLVKALMLAVPALAVSTSFTTRRRRPTEEDGRDYHFVSRAEFDEMVRRGAFLEHATVFDNSYATGRELVESALSRGQDLLLEIDWQGAAQVRKALPEATTIFILPPSRESLEQRLRGRATDSEAVIARRLKDSVTELSHWRDFEYVVVNDLFEQALADLKAIVDGHGDLLKSTRPEVAERARKLLD